MRRDTMSCPVCDKLLPFETTVGGVANTSYAFAYQHMADHALSLERELSKLRREIRQRAKHPAPLPLNPPRR